MTRSAELTANGHAHAIVLTGVLWVLVVLAGLNEIATRIPAFRWWRQVLARLW
jgi:hypothetical protein